MIRNKKRVPPGLAAGAAILLLFLLPTVLVPLVSGVDPNAMQAGAKLLPPAAGRWFGTDQFGRDIFVRVFVGAGDTLSVAAAAVLIGAFFGVLTGAVSGFFGGWADAVLMRLNDAVTAFPAVLLALVLMSLFSSGGAGRLILALGVVFIPGYARVTRGAVASVSARGYIAAARSQGVRRGRILFVHVLPNTLPSLLPALTIGFNNAVLAEAGMSYLGVGAAPPDASLGLMLSEAQGLLFSAPWYALIVCAALLIPVFGVGLIGAGLQRMGGEARA